MHGYVAKTVVYGGLKREGLQHDGTAAGTGLSGDLESSESATLGGVVARKSAPRRAPMSYKAALCKGLGAANSSEAARVATQPATTRVKSQATAGKGTRVASVYHEAAVRGGRWPARRLKAMQRGNQTTTRNSSYGAAADVGASAVSVSAKATRRDISARQDGGSRAIDSARQGGGHRNAQSAVVVGSGGGKHKIAQPEPPRLVAAVLRRAVKYQQCTYRRSV